MNQIKMIITMSLFLGGIMLTTNVNAQTYNQNTQDVTDGVNKLNKLTTIMTVCTDKLTSGDTSILNPCMEIIRSFNLHMDQVFGETVNQRSSIFLGY